MSIAKRKNCQGKGAQMHMGSDVKKDINIDLELAAIPWQGLREPSGRHCIYTVHAKHYHKVLQDPTLP